MVIPPIQSKSKSDLDNEKIQININARPTA